jgi:hypothetical protein
MTEPWDARLRRLMPLANGSRSLTMVDGVITILVALGKQRCGKQQGQSEGDRANLRKPEHDFGILISDCPYSTRGPSCELDTSSQFLQLSAHGSYVSLLNPLLGGSRRRLFACRAGETVLKLRQIHPPAAKFHSLGL